MQKVFYILVIFFALPFIGFTQNDRIASNKDALNFKNQLDINVELLGVAFGYKKRIYHNFFIGAKISGGVIGAYIIMVIIQLQKQRFLMLHYYYSTHSRIFF